MSFFDQEVARTLERVHAAYPSARVAAIRERMERFWNGEGESVPFSTLFGPAGLERLPDTLNEEERELLIQLYSIEQHAAWDSDDYPALSPGCKQNTLPSYFGCAEKKASASTAVTPVIRDAQDVYSLPFELEEGSTGWRMLRRMALWDALTEHSLPLFEADMQGPFSVASQVWGIEAFLLALYDTPEEVHHLLARTTQAVIEYTYRMLDIVGDRLVLYHCQPSIYYPRAKGLAVSEDLLAIVAPPIVEEFIRPYAERIALEFGGVWLHSCGRINHVVRELNAIRGLVGVNFSSCETDLEQFAAERREGLFIVAHNSPVNNTGLPMLSTMEHIHQCGDVFRRHGGRGVCIAVQCAGALDPARDSLEINRTLGR